jgi:hypothetical protein
MDFVLIGNASVLGVSVQHDVGCRSERIYCIDWGTRP